MKCTPQNTFFSKKASRRNCELSIVISHMSGCLFSHTCECFVWYKNELGTTSIPFMTTVMQETNIVNACIILVLHNVRRYQCLDYHLGIRPNKHSPGRKLTKVHCWLVWWVCLLHKGLTMLSNVPNNVHWCYYKATRLVTVW